jgi:hypothetical protein
MPRGFICGGGQAAAASLSGIRREKERKGHMDQINTPKQMEKVQHKLPGMTMTVEGMGFKCGYQYGLLCTLTGRKCFVDEDGGAQQCLRARSAAASLSGIRREKERKGHMDQINTPKQMEKVQP